ncbi:LxmA leader domain family RiPP [Herbidospora mongoliensis]|nr:LxmA leader domain family RiPP [Herbidospora mongoliensis]
MPADHLMDGAAAYVSLAELAAESGPEAAPILTTSLPHTLTVYLQC